MRPISYAIALCLVIAALAGAAYFLLVKAPADAAENYARLAARAIDGIAERLHYKPTVTVNQRTEIYQNRQVLEVTLIEGTLAQENIWKQEWLGSVKEILLRGTYRVKTGFVLDGRFLVDLDPARKIATVHLPPPRVLSVEQIDLEVAESEGWWNKLTVEDRESGLKELQRMARLRASTDESTLKAATEEITRKLDGFFTEQGWGVRYTTFDPRPSATPLP